MDFKIGLSTAMTKFFFLIFLFLRLLKGSLDELHVFLDCNDDYISLLVSKII